MAVAKTAKSEGLIYNGHPLRRKDNLIYYGTMAEKYIIQMQILETKRKKTSTLRPKWPYSCSWTDPTLSSKRRVEKKTEKDSLYAAMDLATVWLDRALAGK